MFDNMNEIMVHFIHVHGLFFKVAYAPEANNENVRHLDAKSNLISSRQICEFIWN